MGWLDPFATPDEYYARTGDHTSGSNPVLIEQLVAASDYVRERLGANFNQSATDTIRYYDGDGTDLLRVDGLVSVAANGIAVDLNADGTYSTTFGTSSWAVLTPVNAPMDGKPYTGIRLLSVGSPTITTWPKGYQNVKVTGVHGAPSVPPLIKELTIRRAAEIRHEHLAQTPPTYGEAPLAADDTWRLWARAEAIYSRKVPGIA